MKKEIYKWIIISLSFSLTTLLTFICYAAWTNISTKSDGQTINATTWNELVTNINTIWSTYTPTWAIMAFNLTACPTGWTEYTAARGRFLRGIDPTGTNDTIRNLGDIQADAFQWHRHFMAWSSWWWNQASWYIGTYWPLVGWVYPTSDATTDGTNGGPRIWNETRPKNVAVLYCEKQ